VLYIAVLLLLYYILFLVQNSYNYIADLTGIFYTNKALGLGLLFVFGSFSGIPPFGTFVGKFYLFNNLALTHSAWVVLFFLLSNVISLIYYLRIAVTVMTLPTKDYLIETPSTNLAQFWLILENSSSDDLGFMYLYIKVSLNITALVLLILGSNIVYPFLLYRSYYNVPDTLYYKLFLRVWFTSRNVFGYSVNLRNYFILSLYPRNYIGL